MIYFAASTSTHTHTIAPSVIMIVNTAALLPAAVVVLAIAVATKLFFEHKQKLKKVLQTSFIALVLARHTIWGMTAVRTSAHTVCSFTRVSLCSSLARAA
jgi:hypothetical protein